MLGKTVSEHQMYIDREDKEILKITSMDYNRIIAEYVKKKILKIEVYVWLTILADITHHFFEEKASWV